jgi:hypothetical protein
MEIDVYLSKKKEYLNAKIDVYMSKKKEYLNAKIDEVAINSKIKNIRN